MPAFVDKVIETFADPTVNMKGDLLGRPGTGTSNGFWVNVEGYDKICLGVITTGAGTFLICGHMGVGTPDDTDDGFPLYFGQSASPASGATLDPTTGQIAVTAANQVPCAVKTPIGWIKVKVIANAGTMSAPFRAV